jgi:HEAT repeat protein
VTPATQRRRGATCAALGAAACAGLLVLWTDARDPPTTRPAVQSDRGEDAVRAFAASEPSQTKSRRSTSRVDSDPSTDETGIGNRDALAALLVALGDADANVRLDAVSDLGLFSDTQTESLLAVTAMQDPAAAVRVEALYALGSLRAESQLATFRHALDDPDKDVRNTAVSALEELGGSASAELLRVALSDRDAAVRAAAAEALADFRTAR